MKNTQLWKSPIVPRPLLERSLVRRLLALGALIACLLASLSPLHPTLAQSAPSPQQPALTACEVIANQPTWRIKVDANYDHAAAFANREASVNQVAAFEILYEREYIDADKVTWIPKSATGVGSIHGQSVLHAFDGDQKDSDDGSGGPVAVHGMLRLNRALCTYELWVDVSINVTARYDGGSDSTHLGSPVEFHVQARAVPSDTVTEVPTFGSAEYLPAFVVTKGDPEEFVPSYRSSLPLASANGSDTAGSASVAWRMIPTETVCATRRGTVIDASDPILKRNVALLNVAIDYDDGYVLPNGKTRVRGWVSCEGVPVSAARVFIVGGVFPKSGQHLHSGGYRPEGYLNGKKLTQADAHIELTSDARGRFEFDFEPGRDTLRERIGIAGEYHLSANLPDFPITTDSLDIIAKVPDLKPLESSQVTYWDLSYGHGAATHWGTPQTLRGVEALAKIFYEAQVINNNKRVQSGKGRWPIVALLVNDISLPWGGLFDVQGWDAAAGRVRGGNWQPPHYTHTDGKEVDFSVRPFADQIVADWSSVRADPLTPAELNEAAAFSRMALRSLGGLYGSWISKQTYTLQMYQNFGSAERGAADIAAGPDPEVAIFPSDAGLEQNPVIAAGQTISLTLIAHNLQGSATATGTTVRATLPAGLTLAGANPTPSRMEGGQPVWALGDLVSGTLPGLIELAVTPAAGLSAGTPLTVSAQVATSGADANPANNEDATALVWQALGPDLAVSTDLDETALPMGTTKPFSLTVANYGTTSAPSAELKLTVPNSITFKGAFPAPTSNLGGKDLLWQLGSLASNASRTVIVSVEVKSNAADLGDLARAPLNFTASVSPNGTTDLFDDNNALNVTPTLATGADLGIGLNLPQSVHAGDVLTLSLPYINRGALPAPTATLSVSLGAGLTVIDALPIPAGASSPTSTPAVSADGVAWALGELGPGASGVAQLRVNVGAIAAQGGRVQAALLSEGFDSDIADNLRTLTLWPTGAQSADPHKVFLPALQA